MKFLRIRLALVPLVTAVGLALVVAVPSPASASFTANAACAQHSQAWLKAFGYGILHSDLPDGRLTIPAGVPIFHTAIVPKNTRAKFQYLDNQFNPVLTYYSAFAGSNCVAPHENAVFDTTGYTGATFVVLATFVQWENGITRAAILGALTIT